jgi:uncharacterized SAM-binding protein YcdF (DUF218 family)
MKHILIVVVPIALLGTAVFLLHERILLAIGDFLVVQDELHPADVIHVIAGPDHRTDYAIQLYKQGYGKEIFFTGGWCSIHMLYHGEQGRRRAIDQGVPPEAIAIDDSDVTSTYSEAVRLKEFVAASLLPIHWVIVVSDPHHMRRVRWTYQRVFGNSVSVQMAPVPFEQSPYQRHWWTDEASRRNVGEEYLKIVYYYARYQLTWGPMREWLASLDRG